MQRHHHFLEAGVAGALADAVDGHLGLARARGEAGQGVRRRHAQIVVAVHRPDHAIAAVGLGDQPAKERPVLLRGGVADGVGNVERGGARLDRDAQHLDQESDVGAAGVLGRELDVGAEAARQLDHVAHLCHHLGARHLELALHVQVGAGDEGVDARLGRRLDPLPALLDVAAVGAREAADDRTVDGPHLLRDAPHRMEVVGGGRREPGLHHVDAEARELPRDLELLHAGEGRARRLLSVAQSGVEDADAIVARRLIHDFSFTTNPRLPLWRPGTASSRAASCPRPRPGASAPACGGR